MTGTTQAIPTQESAVGKAMNAIERRLVEQKDAVANLQSKLDPVLLPEEPSNKKTSPLVDEKTTKSRSSSLTSSLYELEYKANRITNLIQRITARVEV